MDIITMPLVFFLTCRFLKFWSFIACKAPAYEARVGTVTNQALHSRISQAGVPATPLPSKKCQFKGRKHDITCRIVLNPWNLLMFLKSDAENMVVPLKTIMKTCTCCLLLLYLRSFLIFLNRRVAAGCLQRSGSKAGKEK